MKIIIEGPDPSHLRCENYIPENRKEEKKRKNHSTEPKEETKDVYINQTRNWKFEIYYALRQRGLPSVEHHGSGF